MDQESIAPEGSRSKDAMPAKPWDEPKLLKLEAGEAKAGGSKLYADGAFIS